MAVSASTVVHKPVIHLYLNIVKEKTLALYIFTIILFI